MNFWLLLPLFFINGFIALSYEVYWFRIYSFLTASAAFTFGLFLGAYLLGLALGAKWMRQYLTYRSRASAWGGAYAQSALFYVVGACMSFCVVLIVYHAVIYFKSRIGFLFLALLPATGMFGALFPWLAYFGVKPDESAGNRISYLYFANILGSVLGSLVTGFILFEYFSAVKINQILFGINLLPVVLCLIFGKLFKKPWLTAGFLSLLGILWILSGCVMNFDSKQFFGRLLYHRDYFHSSPLIDVKENRHGTIVVNEEKEVYGNGGYDGIFSVGLVHAANRIERAYVLGVLHPKPERVLVIGLGSGAWTKVISHLPGVQKVVVVEINPGYQDVIRHRSETRSIFNDPKITFVFDDARRWLRRNPFEKFDLIVQNTSIHNQANSTNLLSKEHLELIDKHLRSGGVFEYNTTHSVEVLKTGFMFFEYGLRIMNSIAVSHSPIEFSREHWLNLLTHMQIDNRPVLQLSDAEQLSAYERLGRWADTLYSAPEDWGLETRESFLQRTQGFGIVTDDNLAPEFK